MNFFLAFKLCYSSEINSELDESQQEHYLNDSDIIDSYVIQAKVFDSVQSELPFRIKFLSAFIKSYREYEIGKTKYGDWRLDARSGNYTIRFFKHEKIRAIEFAPTPPKLDCPIKLFRILFASRGRVFAKSRVYQLERNSEESQIFDLSGECCRPADAIKIEVLDNWGSLASTCLYDYLLFR